MTGVTDIQICGILKYVTDESTLVHIYIEKQFCISGLVTWHAYLFSRSRFLSGILRSGLFSQKPAFTKSEVVL